MLVKYGGGVIGASGSIAGNVAARNRFGNYMRAKTKPINPRSSRQSAARSVMQRLAEYWRLTTMTQAERDAWETYAAAVNWQNALGEVVHLTGFQMFMRSNARRLACSATIVEAGPTTLSLPGADPTLAITGTASDQLLSVVFDNTLDWAGETGSYLAIYMGQPKCTTRNFFGGPWRFADVIAGVTGTPPTSPATMTAPFVLVEGQKIWTKASIVGLDGRCSDFFQAAPVDVAA